VYKKPWVDLLSESTRDANRYDFAAFWAFIAWKYGGPKTVGDVADFAFKRASSVSELWGCLAAYLKQPLEALHLEWVKASLEVAFWRSDAVRARVAARVLGTPPRRKAPALFDKKRLAWSRPTCKTLEEASVRLERFGFEVLDATATDTPVKVPEKFCTRVHLYFYGDGSHRIVTDDENGRSDSVPDTVIITKHLLAFGFV
jgi:hypothetical protein